MQEIHNIYKDMDQDELIAAIGALLDMAERASREYMKRFNDSEDGWGEIDRQTYDRIFKANHDILAIHRYMLTKPESLEAFAEASDAQWQFVKEHNIW